MKRLYSDYSPFFEHKEYAQQQQVAVLNCRDWMKLYVGLVTVWL